MSIVHRPTDETLTAFAAGSLDEGLALVVAAHLELDPLSRRRLRDLEAVQGALLEAVEPVAMSGTFEAPTVTPVQAAQTAPSEPGLPRVLRPYVMGSWRKIGPRIAMRRVDVPGAEARVFMLRAAPGVSLPQHKHSGFEWTTILSGAFAHEHGRFAAGDFDEADSDHIHTPRVDPSEGCTCIAAVTGEVLFQSWLGRLLQPLVRL